MLPAMNIAFSTARSGMATAAARFDASAARTATGRGDLVDEAVEQTVAAQGFKANARVMQASLDMERSTLQLWA